MNRLDAPLVTLEWTTGGQTYTFPGLDPAVADIVDKAITGLGYGTVRVVTGEQALVTMPEMAYSPTQPRRSDGKFGTGGGTSAPKVRGAMTPEGTKAALAAVGVESWDGLGKVDPVLRGEIVSSFERLQAKQPDLFKAMSIGIHTSVSHRSGEYAGTDGLTFDARTGTPGKVGVHRTGRAEISLQEVKFIHADQLHEHLRSDHERGWLGGGTVDHLISHEVGHVLDMSRGPLGRTRQGEASASGPWATATRGTRATTEYGKANKAERFAEEFAIVSAGGTVGNASGDVMRQMVDEG